MAVAAAQMAAMISAETRCAELHHLEHQLSMGEIDVGLLTEGVPQPLGFWEGQAKAKALA